MARFSQVPIKVCKAKEVASKVRKEEHLPREVPPLPAVKVVKTPEAVEAEAVLDPVEIPPSPRVEPTAQWVEVEPGVYDIIVTCSCGERTVVRCHAAPPSV